MNATETRQYEMLLRIRDFGNTHRELFESSTVAQEAFATVSAAIDELTATDLRKMSASVSARADRKTTARKALTDLLLKACQLVRVLTAQGETMPTLELPASRSDQALLTAGRQFARDTEPFEAVFSGHGLGPKVIADATAAFEKALLDRGMKRADHTAAATRIRDLLIAAALDVRRLDLIVESQLADDNPMLAVWKQARRVQEPRRRGSNVGEISPAPPPAPTDTPTAAVIDMPSREAA